MSVPVLLAKKPDMAAGSIVDRAMDFQLAILYLADLERAVADPYGSVVPNLSFA